MHDESTDSFREQSGAEDVLKRHGPDLVNQAREVLRARPGMRVAGLIAAEDSKEARLLHESRRTGRGRPSGTLTRIVPQRYVDQLLTQMVGTERWVELVGEPQRALPVIAATRDGVWVGFFPLGGEPGCE